MALLAAVGEDCVSEELLEALEEEVVEDADAEDVAAEGINDALDVSGDGGLRK